MHVSTGGCSQSTIILLFSSTVYACVTIAPYLTGVNADLKGCTLIGTICHHRGVRYSFSTILNNHRKSHKSAMDVCVCA